MKKLGCDKSKPEGIDLSSAGSLPCYQWVRCRKELRRMADVKRMRQPDIEPGWRK
ncbi:hypothetical protein JYU29_11270 [Tianweitania sp. BSSL-BM11]|uniref:Uncharacterized protein n=1 Tax=Tianweitania aestuarii TaxID=2814886 RepID=A0ABS5RW25_9HYPH|nr:hypothetical protein [Tianweitania aestuarii]MBS9721268.1 hypothetical protein [Tianweitania aestuarii]